MTGRRKKYGLPGLAALVCILSFGGCAREMPETFAESVELLEPVGVSNAWEEATRRDMYQVKVYSGAVLPYVEEYGFDRAQTFCAYGAYPGEQIKKGGALLYGDTKELDQQIEEMQKRIAEMDAGYDEDMAQMEKDLEKYREEEKLFREAVERLEKSRPAQYITAVNESGEAVEKENPDYGEWKQNFDYCDPRRREAWLAAARLEQQKKKRAQLYELDRSYSLSQLERMRKKKREGALYSGITGTVVSMEYYGWNMGDWGGSIFNVPGNSNVMAVGDLNRKRVCCEYINDVTVNGAQEVYAFIHGKRYEVEYESMDEAEVRAMIQNEVSVYSSFWLQDAEDVEQGEYAVIVLVSEKRREALSIPRAALHRDDTGSYVYVRQGTESVYTPVRTGLYEGLYVEILSGLQEGDQVLSSHEKPPGEGALTLAKGEVHSEFSTNGELYYTSTTTVENPVKYGTCYCVEMPLLFQQVEKGEVIARIRVEPDGNTIAQYERKLRRERERLADLKAEGGTWNEKTVEQKEEAIAELEKELEEIRADGRLTEIRSPVSGIITSRASYEEGDIMANGRELCVIADPGRCFIWVNDENRLLNLGNEAVIGYRNKQDAMTESTGRVVTVNPMGLSPDLRSNRVLIMLPEEMMEDMSVVFLGSGNYRGYAPFPVKVETRRMDHVVLVPKTAVTVSGGNTYVNVRTPDGRVVRKSFIAGGSDGKNYWVVEGLTEGMEICSE